MIELQFLGPAADGLSLVFTDGDGRRYSAALSDRLRAATRRDRPRLTPVENPRPTLRPREIQALLRAGSTSEEIAQTYGADVERVRRFEPPIVAERRLATSRVQGAHVSGPDSPTIGDVVVDRLAARGVDSATLSWSARRRSDGPWEVSLTFVQGAEERAAHWTLGEGHDDVAAVDQEARWLTETSAPAPPVRALVAGPAHSAASEEDARAREDLVDRLNARRGRREPTEDEEHQDGQDPAGGHAASGEPGPISARIYSLARAGHAATSEAPAPEASADPPLPGVESPATSRGRPPRHSKRRPVPSWDEIVFGTRGD